MGAKATRICGARADFCSFTGTALEPRTGTGFKRRPGVPTPCSQFPHIPNTHSHTPTTRFFVAGFSRTRNSNASSFPKDTTTTSCTSSLICSGRSFIILEVLRELTTKRKKIGVERDLNEARRFLEASHLELWSDWISNLGRAFFSGQL